MQHSAGERQALAGMLHDDVLQGLIAARWALDSIDPDGLPAPAAAAVADALRALDQTQDRIRERIVELRRPGGGAGPDGVQAPPEAGPSGGPVR